MPIRKAEAAWHGTFAEGEGEMRLGSGAFEGAFSYRSRMEEGPGTNPEELLGAAHAGCLSMSLARRLSAAGYSPELIRTEARARGGGLHHQPDRPAHGGRGPGRRRGTLPGEGRSRQAGLRGIQGACGRGGNQPGGQTGRARRLKTAYIFRKFVGGVTSSLLDSVCRPESTLFTQVSRRPILGSPYTANRMRGLADLATLRFTNSFTAFSQQSAMMVRRVG